MKLTKKTKLIYGVGINDADYTVNPMINGKRRICPFYKVWVNMLVRCYSESFHKKTPTYIGCHVISEWLIFSNFKLWMKSYEWQGKELDKDILIQGNKVYSPSTCIFVTHQINSLLNNSTKSRGLLPLGVIWGNIASCNPYRAQVNACGKKVHLGCYSTPEEAHEAYKKFKYNHIAKIASQQIEPLRTALLNYVIEP
jgi:hypothetical protein